MAFTSAQQQKIMQVLGYPAKTLLSGSVVYNKVIVDRLAGVPSDAETLVGSLLTSIAAIETQVGQAPARLAALEVKDIKLNNEELQNLRSERKKLAKEIASLLDIPYTGSSSMIGVCC